MQSSVFCQRISVLAYDISLSAPSPARDAEQRGRVARTIVQSYNRTRHCSQKGVRLVDSYTYVPMSSSARVSYLLTRRRFPGKRSKGAGGRYPGSIYLQILIVTQDPSARPTGWPVISRRHSTINELYLCISAIDSGCTRDIVRTHCRT
jgi:hypothetical protein